MSAVTTSIRWMCMQASSMYPEVMQGMASEYVHCDPDTMELSTHAFWRGPCEVLVLEPGCAQASVDACGLHNIIQSSERALTLVLLPAAQASQAIAWLNAGADRCLPRETDIRVIQAMIRAMLHRRRGLLATYTEHGQLRYESDTQTLSCGSVRVPLTRRETLVASLLFQHLRRHVRHDEIMQALCSAGPGACAPTLVSLYIHRINKKIRPFGVCIGFKRGYGYRLHADPSKPDSQTHVPWLGAFKSHELQSPDTRTPQLSPGHL